MLRRHLAVILIKTRKDAWDAHVRVAEHTELHRQSQAHVNGPHGPASTPHKREVRKREI
jgi:hypothetical protein